MANEAAWEYSLSIASIMRCVTNEQHFVRPSVNFPRQSFVYSLSRPAPLQSSTGGRSGLQMAFREIVAFAPLDVQTGALWQRETTAYEYRLLDHHARELLVYHWHPEAAGPDYPHIHVSATLNAQIDAMTWREIALDKRHVVTGLVELRQFARMLITEFNVRPLRSDWQRRLAATSR